MFIYEIPLCLCASFRFHAGDTSPGIKTGRMGFHVNRSPKHFSQSLQSVLLLLPWRRLTWRVSLHIKAICFSFKGPVTAKHRVHEKLVSLLVDALPARLQTNPTPSTSSAALVMTEHQTFSLKTFQLIKAGKQSWSKSPVLVFKLLLNLSDIFTPQHNSQKTHLCADVVFHKQIPYCSWSN